MTSKSSKVVPVVMVILWCAVAPLASGCGGDLSGAGLGALFDRHEGDEDGGGTTSIRSALTVMTTNSEYKLAATMDPDVLPDRFTEMWARVYRPSTLAAGVRYPLLVFLHGNHRTCGHGTNPRVDDNIEYTFSGTCPDGYVVAPSHDGYGYVADQLASQGYIVVSINANRGINFGDPAPGDPNLNLARGRLILKHLTMLSQWNRGVAPTPASVGASLQGHLDFSQVGLMGHSRGGEGVRAAYNQYLAAGSPWPGRIVTPVRFLAMFEVAPVDRQVSPPLDAPNLRWSVLLPMCDGDVSDLEGIMPFDRVLSVTNEQPPGFKANLTIWGANHNYFNTEWQTSDSFGCADHPAIFDPMAVGSPAQQAVGRFTMASFFLSNVGPQRDPSLNGFLDPLNALPSDLTAITRVDRGFTLSPDSDVTLRLEDFVNETGTSTFGRPNQDSGITIVHGTVPEHDPEQFRGAQISWSSAGAGTFFQTNFTDTGSGISLQRYETLDLRVDRAFDSLNPATATDFTVQLVSAQNVLSAPQRIASYLDLSGPVGLSFERHSMLQTARIPLSRFAPTTLGSIRGVRLTFDRTPSGDVYVGNIRATRTTCAATPKLDVKVRQVVRHANEIQFRLQVFNRDAAPVRLSDLSMRLWVSDPTANLVSQVYYGGHVFDGKGAYQYGGVTATAATARVQPACSTPVDRAANWSATIAATDGRSLPANGGVWVDAILSVHRADWTPFASLTDDFSQTPAYQQGVVSDAVWPTSYGDDSHFVLYYRGIRVGEVVTATGPDPAGGAEPTCLAGCIGSVTSALPPPGDSSPSSLAQAVINASLIPGAPSALGPIGSATAPTVAPGRILTLTPTALTEIAPGGVDIDVASDSPLPGGDQILVLHAGAVEAAISRYPDPADPGRIAFTFSAEQFASLQGGEPVTICLGHGQCKGTQWVLGPLDKSLLVP